MFTYIKLKNFKSLKDVTLNLKETQKKIKKFVAIYGENGCGKTNLVLAFDILKTLMLSKIFNNALDSIPKDYHEAREYMEKTDMFSKMFDFFIDIKKLRMVNEKEPTEIEYGFSINDYEGYYYIKFDEKILEEKLYYKENKQRNIHFEIKNVDGKIEQKLNNTIFFGKKYKEELEELIEKYWGKHTFLAIMYEEFVNKNKPFIDDNISNNIIDVINNFSQITVRHEKVGKFPSIDSVKNKFNIEEGKVETNYIGMLDKYEKVLKIFFTQAYADIKDVFYKRKETEYEIRYELYFKKLIANKVRDISYRDESSGTRRILLQFNNMIEAINGKTVIIDEIDNGIHDILIKNIILSMKDEITGQFIITTHNTLLLEELPAKELYLITVDYNGNKSINCVTDYDFKIQKHNNVRDLYFKGVFGGIPTGEYIDFEEIKHTLVDEQSEEVE